MISAPQESFRTWTACTVRLSIKVGFFAAVGTAAICRFRPQPRISTEESGSRQSVNNIGSREA